MAHPLNLISHDSRIPKENHMHRCPWCKRFRWESNLVCQKTRDHTFLCMTCMSHWRGNFGLDSLVDAVLPAAATMRGPVTIQDSPFEERAQQLSVDEAMESAHRAEPRVQLVSPETMRRFFREWRDEKMEAIELADARRRNVDILTGLPKNNDSLKHPGI
jgi:hypothetical protein